MKHKSTAVAQTRWSEITHEHGLPLVVYAFVAIVLTWPLALHFTTAFPSEPGEGAQDLWEKMWNLWWFTTALREGVNPFHTDMLFYPRGASLLFHPLNPTSALMALPFRVLFGPIVSYNMVIILSFVLAGYATYLVVRRIDCGRLAALVSGLAFTACTFHIFHMRLSHLELIPIQWLPFSILALDAVLHHPTPRRIAVLTVALLLVLFTSLYLTLYTALLTVVWLGWKCWHSWRRWRPLLRAITGVGIASAFAFVVAGPTMLIPMAAETRQSTYMIQTVDASAQRAAGTFDIVLPPPTHPLRHIVDLAPPRSSGAFVGYTALVLALIGASARLRHSARWLILAVVAWLFALGPAVPLYRWLYAIPLFQVSRYPDRFMILTVLAVAVLAGLGVERIIKRRTAFQKMLLAGALFSLVLVESFAGPFVLARAFDNPFYHQLAQQPEQFSVLELPINRVNSAWLDMYTQTLHHHPIPNGTLARRVPRIPYEWMPLVQQLEHRDIPQDIVVQDPVEQLSALHYFGIRYIIYHRYDGSGAVTPPSASDVERISGVPTSVAYSDDELVAFRLELPAGNAKAPTMAQVASGWYDLEGSGSDAHRWARDGRGTFDVYVPDSRTVAIRIKVASYFQPRTIQLLLDGQQVGQIDAQPWTTEIETPPFLIGEGTHQLEVVAVEPPTTPRDAENVDDDRPLSVGVWSMELEAR